MHLSPPTTPLHLVNAAIVTAGRGRLARRGECECLDRAGVDLSSRSAQACPTRPSPRRHAGIPSRETGWVRRHRVEHPERDQLAPAPRQLTPELPHLAGVVLSGRANPWKDTRLPASGSRRRCVRWRVRREATRRSRETEDSCIWIGRRIQVGLAGRTAELPGRAPYTRTVVPRMDPADGPGNRRRAQSDAISGIVKRAAVRRIRQSGGSPCLS